MQASNQRISVLVVDDNDVYRSGVAAVLGREEGIHVAASLRTGSEAIQFLESRSVDVLITEAKLVDMSGPTLSQAARKWRPHIAIIILSSFVDDTIIHASLSADVRGYLVKDGSGSEIVDAVRRSSRGEPTLASCVIERVVEWAKRAGAVYRDSEMLAPQEILALSLAAQGLSSREMATRMSVSITTLKQHMRLAMKKLGTSQRAEAVAAGIRRGVI